MEFGPLEIKKHTKSYYTMNYFPVINNNKSWFSGVEILAPLGFQNTNNMKDIIKFIGCDYYVGYHDQFNKFRGNDVLTLISEFDIASEEVKYFLEETIIKIRDSCIKHIFINKNLLKDKSYTDLENTQKNVFPIVKYEHDHLKGEIMPLDPYRLEYVSKNVKITYTDKETLLSNIKDLINKPFIFKPKYQVFGVSISNYSNLIYVDLRIIEIQILSINPEINTYPQKEVKIILGDNYVIKDYYETSQVIKALNIYNYISNNLWKPLIFITNELTCQNGLKLPSIANENDKSYQIHSNIFNKDILICDTNWEPKYDNLEEQCLKYINSDSDELKLYKICYQNSQNNKTPVKFKCISTFYISPDVQILYKDNVSISFKDLIDKKFSFIPTLHAKHIYYLVDELILSFNVIKMVITKID
jgi:hypothetical protein